MQIGILLSLTAARSGAPPEVPTLVEYQTNYAPAGSSYGLWTGMWNVGGLTAGVDFQTQAEYYPTQFPDNTRIFGYVPDPGFGGIYGYPQVYMGNYDGGAPSVATEPVQVRDLAAFDVDVAFTIPGGVGKFNLLDEFYLVEIQGNNESKSREIGWMRHTNDETAAWVTTGTFIGVYTDEDGTAWDAWRTLGGSAGVYIVFHPVGNVDRATGSDRRRAIQWLLQQGEISPNLWINGTAVGVEPIDGIYDVTFTNFDATLTGGVAATNLVTVANDLTDAFWTADGVTKTDADTILETATTNGHTVYNMTITRAAGAKHFTAWAEVEGVNRSYAKLQAFAGYFGTGYAGIVANLSTNEVSTANSGSWAISNAFCVAIPGSTKKRIGFDFVTEGASTNLTIAVGPAAALNWDSYAGNVANGLNIGNVRLFDSTLPPRRMAAPDLTAGNAQISVDRAAPAGMPATSYELRHSTDQSTWTTVTMSSDPQVVASLTNGTTYYVQTRAINSAGNGEWSPSASATPSSGPVYSTDFSSSIGWTLNAQVAISGGVMAFTSTGGTFRTASRTLTGLAAGTYRVAYDMTHTAGNLRVVFGGSAGGYESTSGAKTSDLVITAGNKLLEIQCPDAGSTVTVDNLVITKIA